MAYRDVKGSGRDLIRGNTWNLPAASEENPRPRQSVRLQRQLFCKQASVCAKSPQNPLALSLLVLRDLNL
jgi:hypothetical protein